MSLLSRIFALLLSLALVATSGATAALRDREAGAQRLVICTGHGPELIVLGADGEELAPAPHCPDCTIVLAEGPHPPLTLVRPRARQDDTARAAETEAVASPALAQNQPRAPPVRA